MRYYQACFLSSIVLLCASNIFAESSTIFRGIPSEKISEEGVGRLPETLSREKAVNVACVISRIDDKYYWASRENKELSRNVSGAFETYSAVDGSGYIRIILPEVKEAASLLGGAEKKFDYVEHLLIGLRSVTYYGVSE